MLDTFGEIPVPICRLLTEDELFFLLQDRNDHPFITTMVGEYLYGHEVNPTIPSFRSFIKTTTFNYEVDHLTQGYW